MEFCKDISMNTCDTCKWWGQDTHLTNFGDGFVIKDVWQSCLSPKVNGQSESRLQLPGGKYRSYGTCVVLKNCSGPSTEEHLERGLIEREDTHSIPLDEAEPDASDSWGLCFKTGPKFGCIHHTPIQ